jgi:hypothetical protein
MKIEDAIAILEKIKADYGNIPLLIEVEIDGVQSAVEVEEIIVEGREGHGLSALCMM